MRGERGAEPDPINITGGNSSPAYYLERYDGGREGGGGLRCGQIITVEKPGRECCKCLMVNV